VCARALGGTARLAFEWRALRRRAVWRAKTAAAIATARAPARSRAAPRCKRG